jgi:DNA-binding LytR/AlgR family response regulator
MNRLKIKTVVVDDEQEGRDVMKNLLMKCPEIHIVDIAESADEGLKCILEHKPDLVFLDIRMPWKSGLDLARELSEHQVAVTVVFVTAYDEYAIQALRLAAFDYLLKPVDPDELHEVVRRFQAEKLQDDFDRKVARLIQEFRKPAKLRLNSRSGFILVDPSEILYVIADGNYSEIIFSKARREVVTQQIGALSKLLPENTFMRTSRTHLINLDYLVKVDRKNRRCDLERNGECFSVSVSKDMIGEFDRILSAL